MGSLHEVEIEFEGKTFIFAHDDAEDHIFKQLQKFKCFYEQDLLGSLRRFVDPGNFVIDVGANIGNHSIFFAGVCGCSVLAFEPSERARALLNTNIAKNQLGHLVTVHSSALGDERGFGEELGATHNLGATTIGSTSSGLKIERLDDLNIDRVPKLLKIDVEGMELKVLRGAEQTLRTCRPVVSVEAITVPAFERVFDQLILLNYLATEVHNYSATHVFQPVLEDIDSSVAALSRFAGSSFIYHATERHEQGRILRSTQERVKQLAERLAKLETRETK